MAITYLAYVLARQPPLIPCPKLSPTIASWLGPAGQKPDTCVQNTTINPDTIPLILAKLFSLSSHQIQPAWSETLYTDTLKDEASITQTFTPNTICPPGPAGYRIVLPRKPQVSPCSSLQDRNLDLYEDRMKHNKCIASTTWDKDKQWRIGGLRLIISGNQFTSGAKYREMLIIKISLREALKF